jgi:putative nucleotidyltransferase with HDIG domain
MPDLPKGNDDLAFPALLERLQPLLRREALPVYLVGGVVRDALLGRPSGDLDLAVADGAVRLAFRLADRLGVPAYVLDEERDTGRIVFGDAETTVDIARFRGPDLAADLLDRDFTINAMALPATDPKPEQLVDPTGGRADLVKGLLRPTHGASLAHDPIRVLRAVRLAAELGFRLAAETETAIGAARRGLLEASPERIRDEFGKLVAGPAPERALPLLQRLEVLQLVAPELAALAGVAQSEPHFEDVWSHTVRVLAWLRRLERVLWEGEEPAGHTPLIDAAHRLAPYAHSLARHLARDVDGGVHGKLILRLGALFHDVGKAETATTDPETGRIRFYDHDQIGARLARRRLRRLRYSREVVNSVGRIVEHHMRPLHLNRAEKVTRRAVFRFFRATGEGGLDVLLLGLADHLATYDGAGPAQAWQGLLDLSETLLRYRFEQYREVVKPTPLLDGHDVMAATGIRPGPRLGQVLRHIEEAQAAGEVATREQALAVARELVDSFQ